LENIVREDFVGFCNYSQSDEFLDSELDFSENALNTNIVEPIITGKILSSTVVKQLKNLGLDLLFCVGIGCDGCSVNLSVLCVATAEIKTVAKNALICPCLNHALNNTLLRSIKVKSVRNSIGTIQEIVQFFNASSKRNFILKNNLGYQLSSHCTTRWIERHDSLLEFINDLPHLIVQSLLEIST